MTRWVLDAGVVGLVANVFDPLAGWPPGRFEVLEAVHLEAYGRDGGRRAALLDAESGTGPVVCKRRLEAGTAAFDYYWKRLRPARRDQTRDAGEDESIAWCLHEARLAVFVSLDKHATYLALAELGPGRISTPFDLFAELHAEELITADQRDQAWNRTATLGRCGVPHRLVAD